MQNQNNNNNNPFQQFPQQQQQIPQNNLFQFPQQQQQQQQQQQNNVQFQQLNQQNNQNPFQFQNMNMNNNNNNLFHQNPQQNNLQQQMNNNNNNFEQSYIPRKSNQKRKVKTANTNVIGLELGKLGESATVATGDANFCEGCKSMFNSLSVIEEEKEIKINDGRKKWNCEFCGHQNMIHIEDEEMPKEDTIDFLLEPAPELNEKLGETNTVLFIVDISGSMCVTTEVQGKISLKGAFNAKDLNIDTGGEQQWMPNQRNRNVTYISRLQCVQASIEKQIQSFAKDNPNKKIGIITFNNEVTIIGDGTTSPVIIGGDKLDNFDTLLEEGKKLSINNPVKETHKELINKLYKLQESGTTALGPALVVGLGMISKIGKGNTIVLLTDGLANVGVGGMEELFTEEQQQNAEDFYRKVGEMAQESGTTISITGIEGSECKMENLGLVTELSNGEVDIVNPLELTNNFANILSKTIVATECNLIFKVHKGLKIKDDDNIEQEGSDTLTKNIGNVTNDLTCTFEYYLKSFKELKELDFDKLTQLPFQVQIYYRDISGAKKVRSITKVQKVTHDKEEAEKTIDMSVISANAVQGSAKLAQKGHYKEAREKMVMNQKMMNRNLSYQPQQQNYYSNFVNKAVQLDNALLEDERTEEINGNNFEQERSVNKSKSRRNNRSDNVSKNIYQAN